MPPASSEDEDCICRICRFQWGIDLPVPKTGTDDLKSLQKQSITLATSIFRDWVLLNKTLKRYEDVIQKRWTKKNNVQRTKVLLTAWPGMAATHRPDFAQLRDIGNRGCKRRVDRVKERDANLWPYINQEDFVHPTNLLMFLHSRGRCLPHKFAFGDNVCAHAAQPSSKCEEINQLRMVLYDKCTPTSYACLYTFKTGDRTDMLGMHPTTGLLVLEIQERILRFLVSCCRLVLHDIDIDRIDLHQSKPASNVQSSTTTWRTITALTDEAPYRLPQQLDLKRLRMLVEAKRSEAEEHVWSLREDPGYFAQQLQEWAEHTTEMVLDKYKMRHKSVRKPAFWNRVCKALISHAYRSLIFLDELFEEMKILVRLTKTYGKCSHPSRRLPPILEDAYQRFDKLVEEMRHGPLNDLVVGIPASPPLRAGFQRDVQDCTPSFHELTVKPNASRGSAWRVNVLFRTLLSQDQHDKHGLINIIGEIQRTLDEHSVDSEGITSWVANRFSDLALVVEIRHQLDLFQPWSTMWRYHVNKMRVDAEYESIALVDDMVYESVNCGSTKLVVDPADFAYSSDKKRTKDTTSRMREAEECLDAMWQKVDKHCTEHTGYTLHDFLSAFFKEHGRRLQRTPGWIEPKRSEISRPNKQPEREWVLKSLPLQELDPNARCSHPGKAELLERMTPEKSKVKSRPAVDRHVDHEPPKTPKSAVDCTKMKIRVNKRAYKVFSTIFHNPTAGEQYCQGEVAWVDFLYAMSLIGFSPEKLYGSSWQFEPTGIDVNRSIQFHEPHPHVKMHLWLAKRVGRRLNRAYDWDGQTFVCE